MSLNIPTSFRKYLERPEKGAEVSAGLQACEQIQGFVFRNVSTVILFSLPLDIRHEPLPRQVGQCSFPLSDHGLPHELWDGDVLMSKTKQNNRAAFGVEKGCLVLTSRLTEHLSSK